MAIMSTPWSTIVETMWARRSADADGLRLMQEVQRRYNGDIVVPMPDVRGEPELVPPTPQIVANAIDHLSMRAASTHPVITCPAVDDTVELHRKRAATRRRALYATWYENTLAEVKLRRAYRQYHAYGTFALVVVPEFGGYRGDEPGVCIELRDPLSAYPELRSPDDIREPLNVGFVYGRSAAWLRRQYPEATDLLKGNDKFDRLWDVVEWIDADEIVVGILGPRWQMGSSGVEARFDQSRELRRWPNRAGMVPVVAPRRVTLDRVMGQVANAVGMQDLLGKLTALDIIAAERAIFPDLVVMGQNGQPPTLLNARWRDGREGEPNLLVNSEVKLLASAPGPMTQPVIDRIEEATRLTAGDAPFFSGQTYGSLRTGRAIDSLAGYAVDSRIQEAQEVMARSLSCLNEAICETYRGYWPDRKFTLFSGWPTDKGTVKFTPAKDLDANFNVVSYPFAGSDLTGVTVQVNQMTASRLMSRETARTRHPYVEDPERESERITEETILDSIFQAFLTQAASGAVPLIDQARVLELVQDGQPIHKAILTANREAQERQAAVPPPPQPGQAVAPETQAGLALPGQGVETALSRQPQAPQPMQDLHQLLNAMGGGRRAAG